MIGARATDGASFRTIARALLHAEVPPEAVVWDEGAQGSLLASQVTKDARDLPVPEASGAHTVPRSFVETMNLACDHAAPDRFARLYRLLWNVTHGAPRVLEDPLDPDVARVASMVREVREEEHRMHAFVRFRPLDASRTPDGREHWIAWFAPAHPILERVAPFFARRYPHQRWTLMTPTRTAHWSGADGTSLCFGPGAPRDAAPAPDELDALFLTYYASIFNPARTNIALFQKHIPARVQAQLPEGAIMRTLATAATERVAKMKAPRASASAALLPETRDLVHLAEAASRCRACPIGEHATQTVFGEGPKHAPLMIVGEQPGDEEDRAGHPFVGPAGRLLDTLMERAGLARHQAYVTNAVKHFKWEPRGTRRLHSKPNRDEMDACRGWLLAEVEALKPRMILCLGATAAQSFAGAGFRITRDRGKPTSTPWAPWWMATFHPSALLRAPDEGARRDMEETFVADLVLTREALAKLEEGPR